ncbi:MAG: M13 family metallopeptidase [Candidatus Azotimanducaceae bacterium WSBS_2022_MAG_OTU7]
MNMHTRPLSNRKTNCLALWLCLLMASCSGLDEQKSKKSTSTKALVSGVDQSYVDHSIRPQDDFFGHVNGLWLANVQIPADKSRIGTFTDLRDKADADVRAIIEAAARSPHSKGSPEQKVGDLYTSYLDEARIEELQLQPIASYLTTIDAIENLDDLASYLGSTTHLGLNSPIAVGVIEDFQDPTRYTTFLMQSGLGLPDRDYYFDESEEGLDNIAKYRAHISAMFTVLSNPNPGGVASQIYELEKQMAGFQRNPVENRQFDKWDNKFQLENLSLLMTNFKWPSYLKAVGISDQVRLSAAQPEYFAGLDEIITVTPIQVWKDYLKFRLISDTAPLLHKEVYDIHFDFHKRTLRGQLEPLPRWQRGVKLVNDSIGELVGQVYVKEHFPPEAKTRMLELVENLIAAYRESIESNEWMGEDTKAQALIKLENFLPKIGYPEEWKSYDAVTVDPQSLVENIRSATLWNTNFELAKLQKAASRSVWDGNPQVVNAYYHPVQNTITFPAGILQPPFFNMAADDAVNYGAIGMVIGHEIGHGFDDQGSKFDGTGMLRNWWTDEDRNAFEERTGALIKQFNDYEVTPGLFINGELTQGENLGDLAGLSIAYQAYQKSLNGKPAPTMENLTGEQRFFFGAAMAFRGKSSDESAREQVKTDPHSAVRFRINGSVTNVSAFYTAFDVKEGDDLYLPESERVVIW